MNDTEKVQKPRVLIIDDADEILQLEKFMFEREGAEVVALTNGEDGLTSCKAGMVEGRPFDVVVLDIRLPNISGYEVARQMRSFGFKGTIAAFTANATMDGKNQGKESGIDVYFSKAVLKKDLVRALLDRTAS